MNTSSHSSPQNSTSRPAVPLSNKGSLDLGDDDENATIVRKQRARKHLSRALLYSNGARAKLPHVKKVKLKNKSPFTVLQPVEFAEKPMTTHDTQPPGHSDSQYAESFYYTRAGAGKKAKDNELVLTNTTSMVKSVENYVMAGQPPWYVGYQNKTVPPDSSIIYAASRYGFRGSKGIRQYETKPYQSQERTQTQYTPKFLDTQFHLNEWVPAIRVDEFTSPKVWPENAEYATGVPLKRPPTSVSYNRETTVGNDGHREVPPSLSDYIERRTDIDRTLHDFAKLESANLFLSRPMTAQLKFETMWEDKVAKTASNQLRATLREESPFPYQASGLTDPTDEIKYSGVTAMVVHSQSAAELRFRLRLAASKSFTPYERRWKHVVAAFQAIKNYLMAKKEITMAATIRNIADHLRETAANAGQPSTIGRGAFVRCFEKNHYANCLEKRESSALFSTFDPHRSNTTRYVGLIACLVTLDNATHSATDKLAALWDAHEEYGDDLKPIENALAVFCTCCASDADRVAIEKHFKETFRPACYQLALRSGSDAARPSTASKLVAGGAPPSLFIESSPNHRRLSTPGNQRRSTLDSAGDPGSRRPETATTASRRASFSSPTAVSREGFGVADDQVVVTEVRDLPPRPQSAFTVTRPGSRQRVAVRTQFNIADDALTRKLFLELLPRCPALVGEFDRQLSQRLIECFERDPRVTPSEEDNEPAEEQKKKDFSWILGKSGR